MNTPAGTATADTTDASGKAFNLFDVPAGYFDNPYPWFRALREEDPVHRNSDGTVLLTQYADVRTVWRDLSASVDKEDMFRAKFGEGPLLEHHTTAMLFRDPPDHDRLRALVQPFFAPKSFERLRGFIEELVEDLLNEAEERREIDFVSDFAARIPIALITRILGVPPEDGQLLRTMGAKVLVALNPKVDEETVRRGHEGAAQFIEYLTQHIATMRKRGRGKDPETILDGLLAAQEESGSVSELELIHTCILLLNGGHETTTNLMAVGTMSLLNNPSEYARMAGDLEPLGDNWIEEIIRYVSPLQLQGRRTTKEVPLPSGETLPPGTEVILCQASANRDENVFADAEKFTLDRKPNAHVAFGMGVHVCLGRPLARLETKIMMPRLAQRFPKLELAGEPVFNRNVRFRGLASLPVRVS